ncbi:uncharacterized protein LOC142220374 [Haematobia irritans]|uniref:uncharacterized protein LOC142220374 n=1 Tax=Haematobia irritans TaxID=7368 RepID=UPI003F4F6A95
MQIQSTNESLKDPPMYALPGGGGKGIRPNQHSQQQQQHHQSHHQSHHQTPHQQHQTQQVQLQQGSLHHSNQTSAQTSGNSRPHSHPQQTAAPPPHQSAYSHQLPVQYPAGTFYTYNHVGGGQLAPSPPTHISGGNGSQGGSGTTGGTGANNNTNGNANTNVGNSGGGGRQGQGTPNTIPHFAQGTLMQPTANQYMTHSYPIPLQQHNAPGVLMYNSTLAPAPSGQHGNPSVGQTGPMYPSSAQGHTTAAHQATLHNSLSYPYSSLTTPPPAGMQYRVFFSMTGPRMSSNHQQPTVASANSTVQVPAHIANTGPRGATAGPPPYAPSSFCTPPIAAITGQQPSLIPGGIGVTQMPSGAYGHLPSATSGSTSSSSLNMTGGSGALGPISSSTGTEHTGTKPRRHAIPIVHPITKKTLTFDTQTKSTFSALEIKAPSDMENKPAKSSAVTITAPPTVEAQAKPTEKTLMPADTEGSGPVAAEATSTTGQQTTQPQSTMVAATNEGTTVPVVGGGGGGGNKDKTDQQMQTEIPCPADNTMPPTNVEPTNVDAKVMQQQQQPCPEENDDTDADTPELEHDDESSHMDREQTPSNNNENIVKGSGGGGGHQSQVVMDSDTDPTTETDVKSMSQKDDDAGVIKQQQQHQKALNNDNDQQQQQQHIVESQQPIDSSKASASATAGVKQHYEQQQQQQQTKIPTTTHTAAVDKTIEDSHNNTTEDSSKTIQKKDMMTTEEGGAHSNVAPNKEINTTKLSHKDQVKNVAQSSSGNSKMGANTTTSPSIGNANTNKKPSSDKASSAAAPSSESTKAAGSSMAAQQASAAAAAAATAALAAANNDDSFITVSNRKNRKTGRQQQQQQMQQQQQQQRTKDNQKKQPQQQQQQRQQHERSNSTTSNTSTNNKAHNNNNNNNFNNNSRNTTKIVAGAAAPAATPSSNAHLTDIHNANSSSIPSNGNNNKQSQKQQQQPAHKEHTTSSNNNNNVNASEVSKGAEETKDNDNNGKHIKSQAIVDQFLQQPTSKATSSSSSSEMPAKAKATDEQQIQFLNSSSSTCEEEEDKLKQQQKPAPAQQQQTSTQQSSKATPADAATDSSSVKDVRFGDFKEGEKLNETTTTKPTNDATSSAAAAEAVSAPSESKKSDDVDSTSNQTHARPAIVPLPSKPNKALHVTPTIQKHPKGKSNYRYTLDELKLLAKSDESQKIPVVPKGGCVAALFVSRSNNQPNMQQQQYQHMNFSESLDFVPGKRVGNRTQRKPHHMAMGSLGNIAGAGGHGGSTIGTTGGSVSVSGTSFTRPMIHLQLSLNEEIKLNESKDAWKPDTLRNQKGPAAAAAGSEAGSESVESVLKKVRGVLNKLTPENFDVLLKTMVSINLDTTEKMQPVMLLIFEKTISEPNFAPTYAKFCKVLFQELKKEKQSAFNTSLIKRIQMEFESNVNNADAKKEKLKPLLDKLEACTDPKERLELQAELEDQEYQFRRRAWGTVRFIGEMYKLQSLTSDRVMLCIESLLEHGSEEKLEYMCKLLTTVGHLLEAKVSTDKGVTRMDRVFNKINEIIKASRSNKTNHNKISSRVRFMMQDVVDLRGRHWDQSSSNAGPASLGGGSGGGGGGGGSNNSNSQHQNRRGNRDDKNNRNSYDRGGSSQRMGGGGGGGSGSNYGGNNNQGRRMDRDGYYNKNSQKSNYQAPDQSLDFKKLNFSRGSDSSESTTKLGNSSTYMWRTYGRQSGLLQNATAAPPFSGMTSSGSYSGSSSNNNSNSANNTMKRTPSNPFHALSTRESDNERHPNSDVDRPSASHTSDSGSDASNDDDQSVVSYNNKEVRKLINGLVEEYMDCTTYAWQNKVLSIWRAYSLQQHAELVHCLLMDYLHLRDVTKDHRAATATIFAYLLRTKSLDKKTFVRSYDQFAEEFGEVLVDVPTGWTFVFDFLGPLLQERHLTFEDIWRSDWKEDISFTKRFVKALIAYFTKEFGTNYARDMWHKVLKLDRGQIFMDDRNQWQEFINSQGLQYIYDANIKPPNDCTSCNSTTVDKKVKRLEHLLKVGGNSDVAIDYIKTNVNINDEFLRHFARFLCCDYATVMTSSSSSAAAAGSSSANSSSSSSSTKKNNATDSGSNIKIPQVNDELFRKNCVPMLHLCIDAQEKYELACLDAAYDALQQEYSDYGVVDDITCNIFGLLYDSELIAKESLEKWYIQRQAGGDTKSSSSSRSSGGGSGQQLSAQLQAFLQKLL